MTPLGSKSGRVSKFSRGARLAAVSSSAQRAAGIHATNVSNVVNELLARALPALHAAVDGHLRPLFDEAVKRWPVDTGYSRSRLRLDARVAGDSVIYSITNDASYAYLIKYKQRPGESPVVEKLIFRPAARAAERMAQAAAKELSR